MKNFDALNLDPAIVQSLISINYTTPTPIQAQAIPFALEGKDIMGSAQTGTGKTAAFSIPLVQEILSSPDSCALVLTPTRELGKQVMGVVQDLLGKKSKIKTAFIIGGEPMGKQFAQLRGNPRIVVGTPGRVNDHLERGSLKLNKTNFLVLDETDRMLDMGFSVQIDRIVKHMPKERQTLMFSATLPDNILSLSKKYLNNPERVSVGSTRAPAADIDQEVIKISTDKKYGELVSQLNKRTGSVVLFVKTKFATERIAKKLCGEGFKAEAINGDMKQSRRERTIKDFRNKKYRILVATDVVARGLDIPHIEHVINYDLPQVAEDYIHRIGRTARAGAKGSALCLISPADMRNWRAIEQLIDPNSKSTVTPKGSFGNKKKSPDSKKKRFNKVRDCDSKTPRRGSSFAKKAGPGKKTADGKKNRWSGTKKKSLGGKVSDKGAQRSRKPKAA